VSVTEIEALHTAAYYTFGQHSAVRW